MRELSLHILDIVENSINARAKLIYIKVYERKKQDELIIYIEDNGCGMDSDFVQKVLDPFVTTRTTRKVGLGIPLFKAAAERCEGNFNIESELGKGTRVTAKFRLSHIDRAPFGDLPGTLTVLFTANPKTDFKYKHTTDDGTYEINTKEIKMVLEDVKISNPLVADWIKNNIVEGLISINGGGE
jgi:hypothetical protein